MELTYGTYIAWKVSAVRVFLVLISLQSIWILCIFPYSVWMQENTGPKNSKYRYFPRSVIFIETIHFKQEIIIKMDYIDCSEATFKFYVFKKYFLSFGQDFRCILKIFRYLPDVFINITIYDYSNSFIRWVYRTQSNTHHGDFLRKELTSESCWLITGESSIMD